MLKKTMNVKFLNHFPVYAFLSFFIVFFIFFSYSFNVKASNTYTLPYNVLDYQNNNSACMAYLNDIFNAITSAEPNFDTTNCILVPTRVNSNVISITALDNPYINIDYSSVSSIWQSTVVVRTNGHGCNVNLGLAGDGSLVSCTVGSTNLTSATLFGQKNITAYYSSIYTYQLNYPFFANTYIYDSANNLIIDVNFEWTPDEPSFQQFQNGLDITSTISNGVNDNLSDIQNQKGFFDNLVSNLKNMFNSLNSWINNGFSNLSKNIKDFFGPFLSNIQNFSSQIKGSVEDFKDHFSHFFEIINSIYNMSLENGEFSFAKFISVLLVPSTNDIDNAFTGHSINTLYHGTVNASKTFYQFFDTVFNGSYVYIYTLPSFTFGGKTFSNLEVNFSWFLSYKTYCDLIISAFLIIGYIKFLMEFVPNFFYGSGTAISQLGHMEGGSSVDNSIPY